MKDLQQQQTISSGLKGNRGRYSLESPPPEDYISFRPELVGHQFGWVKVISPEIRKDVARKHRYVLTKCMGCSSMQWQLLDNLQSGRSKGCQSCSQPRKVPKWLERRMTAAKQRCENPNTKGYSNYGGRGIRFEFASATEAALYMIKEYGLQTRDMEIDRIDTNGNYAPGNLRFSSHRTNCINQRRNVLSEFSQEYWPYAESVVIRKLSAGLSRDEIIQDAEKAVMEKRKNWRLISARLDFMTYEMPENIIVLPYQDTSSTTVDMAAV